MFPENFLLFHSIVTFSSAIFTALIAYAIYRQTSASIWGWIASFIPDTPLYLLIMLGATNLSNFFVFLHTVGIAITGIILIILDILLMELDWIGKVSWMKWPHTFGKIHRYVKIVKKLEAYKAIPQPIRVKRVFVVTILAGTISLVLNFLMGLI